MLIHLKAVETIQTPSTIFIESRGVPATNNTPTTYIRSRGVVRTMPTYLLPPLEAGDNVNIFTISTRSRGVEGIIPIYLRAAVIMQMHPLP